MQEEEELVEEVEEEANVPTTTKDVKSYSSDTEEDPKKHDSMTEIYK